VLDRLCQTCKVVTSRHECDWCAATRSLDSVVAGSVTKEQPRHRAFWMLRSRAFLGRKHGPVRLACRDLKHDEGRVPGGNLIGLHPSRCHTGLLAGAFQPPPSHCVKGPPRKHCMSHRRQNLADRDLCSSHSIRCRLGTHSGLRWTRESGSATHINSGFDVALPPFRGPGV
jgi:hypothetical protein